VYGDGGCRSAAFSAQAGPFCLRFAAQSKVERTATASK